MAASAKRLGYIGLFRGSVSVHWLCPPIGHVRHKARLYQIVTYILSADTPSLKIFLVRYHYILSLDVGMSVHLKSIFQNRKYHDFGNQFDVKHNRALLLDKKTILLLRSKRHVPKGNYTKNYGKCVPDLLLFFTFAFPSQDRSASFHVIIQIIRRTL